MQNTMRIRIDEKWPFFMAYHDKEYIRTHDAREEVVLKEKRESREYRLHNQSGKEIVVYKIDGGLISTNKQIKCDFGIYTEQDVLYLIELKGSDYLHALDQIESSIDILLKEPNINVRQLNARIVLSKNRTPDIRATKEKKLKSLLKTKYGKGTILKRTRVFEETV